MANLLRRTGSRVEKILDGAHYTHAWTHANDVQVTTYMSYVLDLDALCWLSSSTGLELKWVQSRQDPQLFSCREDLEQQIGLATRTERERAGDLLEQARGRRAKALP